MSNNFEDQDCVECFVKFGVPVGFTARRREDKRTFFCPNGHPMSYTQSEADKLRQERDRLKQNTGYLEDQVRRQREMREAAERRASAARGQVTRLKNRAAAGVCPCCNRTFVQLARHMATKHKGFALESTTPIGETVQ